MSTLAATLEALTQLAVAWIAGVAVTRWWRERSRHAAALAAALTMLAAALSGGWIATRLGIDGTWFDAIRAVAFAGSGYAVLEHRSMLLTVPRRWRQVAAAALALSVLAYVVAAPGTSGTGAGSATTLTLVVVWLVIVGEPVVTLWRRATEVPAVRRARLRLLSGAYAIIAVLLVITIALSQSARDRPGVAVAMGAVGLTLMPLLYLAVSPPVPVRRWWLKRHATRAAQQALPIATWYLDLAEGELWWSPQLRELLGVGPDEPASLETFLGRLHPDDRARTEQGLADAVLQRSSMEGLELRMAADGDVRWIQGTGEMVIEPSGEISAVFGIIEDVTDHKRAKQRLEDSLEAERELTHRLREVDRVKSSLLSAVSHELRTPLTAIEGFATTLVRSGVHLSEEDRLMLLSRLVSNSRRLRSLLGDLLDLDRLDRDALELRRRPTDLAQLVRRVVEEVDLGTHPLHLQLPDELVVAVDAPRIERIVENLLVNVVRHTPERTSVWVRLRVADDELVLTVADAGPGVSDDLKPEVFEPFRQGSVSPVRGTGVGLSIVARFTELHGGRAWVDDRPGGGAAFNVALPVLEPIAEEGLVPSDART